MVMANSNTSIEEHRTRQPIASRDFAQAHSNESQEAEKDTGAQSRRLLSTVSLGRSSNSAMRASAMQTMQRTFGNRAVQRMSQGGVTNTSVPRVAVQRTPVNPPPEWWDQAYDTPTEEEMAELEKMYQEGLKEGGEGVEAAEGAEAAEAAEVAEVAEAAPEVAEAAEGAGALAEGGWSLASLLPWLPAIGAGAAVMTYSSTSIVGQDEEMKMLEDSRRAQAAREGKPYP